MKFLKRIITSILLMLPDVKAFQPVTKEMIDYHKENRNSDVLWSDEV